jgi:hypothetical protein
VLLLGFSDTRWGSVPLPLALGGLGLPNCALHTSIDVSAAVVAGTQGIGRGYAFVDVGAPIGRPTANNVRVFAQWLVLPTGGGAALSEVVEWWLQR